MCRLPKNEPQSGDVLQQVAGRVLPVDVVAKRRYSVLENIVLYLKEKDLTLHRIAVLLHRDDRTVWTVMNRAEAKGGEVK